MNQTDGLPHLSRPKTIQRRADHCLRHARAAEEMPVLRGPANALCDWPVVKPVRFKLEELQATDTLAQQGGWRARVVDIGQPYSLFLVWLLPGVQRREAKP